MNASRHYLGSHTHEEMKGKVFVTAGLGGMSGAQPKAGFIAGMIAVVAEVDGTITFGKLLSIINWPEVALNKRFAQGWIAQRETDLNRVVEIIKDAKKNKKTTSIGWLVGPSVERRTVNISRRETLSSYGNDWRRRRNCWWIWDRIRRPCTIPSLADTTP